MEQVTYTGIINNKIYLVKKNLSLDELNRLKEYFRAPNQKYIFLFKKYGRVTPDIPTHINCYEETEEHLILGRGALKELKVVLSDIRLVFKDEENKAEKIEFDQIYHIDEYNLRDYQEKAVEASINQKKCVLVAGCGAGKTVMAMEIIKRLSTQTTIIVHTKELFDQWYNIIKTYLGIEPGVFSGPDRSIGQVNIVMSQLLARHSSWDLSNLKKICNPGLLIIDECHIKHYQHAHKINSEYKIGLTATPIRSDGTTQFITWALGSEVIASTHDELVEKGFRSEPIYKVIETNFYYPYVNTNEYNLLIRKLLNDPERNNLILKEVIKHVKDDRHCLVLTGVKKHAEILAQALKNNKILAAAIHADVPAKNRFEIISKMKKGELAVLTATSVADVGLDIPILDTLFLTYPSKSSALNTQRAGRIMRIHPDKHENPLIIDFVDSKINLFKNQALYRKRSFKKICTID